MKSLFVSLLVIVSVFTEVKAQDNDTAYQMESVLLSYYKTMVDSAWDYTEEDYSLLFKNMVLTVFSTQESWNHNFDRLSKEIKILKTEDEKVRFISWDEYTGGTWHCLVSYAQYKDKNGKIKIIQLHSGHEGRDSHFTDVVYYEVNQFTQNDTTFYLLFGFGTHGAGHHHKIIRLMHMVDNELKDVPNGVGGYLAYTIEAARSCSIGILYDPEVKTIKFDKFVHDPGDFLKPSGEIITLKWNGKTFARQ